MSAVGHRPERPGFAVRLEREIPLYRTLHCVKPGMAGWGLVKQGYGASKEDALIKLQYDRTHLVAFCPEIKGLCPVISARYSLWYSPGGDRKNYRRLVILGQVVFT